MRVLNVSILMVLLMEALMIPADIVKRQNNHDKLHKHHRKVRHHSDAIELTTFKFEKTHKKQSHVVDEHAPEYHNYYVSAEMQYKGTYRECPPFQKLKCRGSKCMYQSCDKQDKWQEDCSITPIEQCESKDWVCDCNNELGYYRLHSLTTECVYIDDIRCKKAYDNAKFKCSEDEEKVCPTDECDEKEFYRAFGVFQPKPTCPNDTEKVITCEKPIKCHCKYPLVKYNEKCFSLKKVLRDPVKAVCPDNCKVKECINRNPKPESLCPKNFTEQELYECKKPLQFICNGEGDRIYAIYENKTYCYTVNDCNKNNIEDKGKYDVSWDYPYEYD